MTDLIARAKEYLEKTKGITDGEWGDMEYYIDDYPHMQPTPFCYINRKDDRGFRVTFEDEQAFLLTPTARALIESYAKRVAYLRSIISFKKACSFSDEDMSVVAGLEMALKVMIDAEEKQ